MRLYRPFYWFFKPLNLQLEKLVKPLLTKEDVVLALRHYIDSQLRCLFSIPLLWRESFIKYELIEVTPKNPLISFEDVWISILSNVGLIDLKEFYHHPFVKYIFDDILGYYCGFESYQNETERKIQKANIQSFTENYMSGVRMFRDSLQVATVANILPPLHGLSHGYELYTHTDPLEGFMYNIFYSRAKENVLVDSIRESILKDIQDLVKKIY